jgi:DNA-binding protein HU-beta
MTRKDQIDVVARVAGITAAQARLALDAVGGVIRFGLREDGRVEMTGVGIFLRHERRPRRIRNVQTGLIMDLPASTTIKFKPAPELRASVGGRT